MAIKRQRSSTGFILRPEIWAKGGEAPLMVQFEGGKLRRAALANN